MTLSTELMLIRLVPLVENVPATMLVPAASRPRVSAELVMLKVLIPAAELLPIKVPLLRTRGEAVEKPPATPEISKAVELFVPVTDMELAVGGADPLRASVPLRTLVAPV